MTLNEYRIQQEKKSFHFTVGAEKSPFGILFVILKTSGVILGIFAFFGLVIFIAAWFMGIF